MGTGFYLPEHDLIITNEHVVRDNCDVIVEGELIKKQIVRVLYLDMKYDLAFLEAPSLLKEQITKGILNEDIKADLNEKVVALGHPFGQRFESADGIITNPTGQQDGIDYYYHDAVLGVGSSGGPLLNAKGEFIGVNTFIAGKEENEGFTLPASNLYKCLNDFSKGEGKLAARCYSCLNVIFEHQLSSSKYCPECSGSLQISSHIPSFEPVGCSKTIELMLEELGHDARLTRRGPNNWGIQQGSAKINISYYEKTGLIIGDASLCNLPQKNIQPLFEYLLRQNNETEGLTFSINDQDIVLSLLIYDRYLNTDTGRILFQHLFERADYYDNVLVEEYGASWKYDNE